MKQKKKSKHFKCILACSHFSQLILKVLNYLVYYPKKIFWISNINRHNMYKIVTQKEDGMQKYENSILFLRKFSIN
jgi:hypothetical protein